MTHTTKTKQTKSRHLEGVGGPGSFIVTADYRGCRQLIASVQVKRGRRTIFIDEVILHMAAPRLLKKERIKDYQTLKTLLTKQLSTLARGGTAGRLRWPWKCVFYCPQHEECENYDWIGFWD